MVKENDGVLTRLVKNSLNPTPLNISFRNKFNLDNNYKLVYLIDRERMHLIIFGLMNCLFPLFIMLICLFAYSELTENSKVSEAFESPYLFIGTLSAYFLLIFFISKMVQSRTVFRIYYNEKLEKFTLIRIKGLFNFKSEDFKSKNVIYRIKQNNANQTDAFIKNISNATGNVYINNKPRRIDFTQFSAPNIIEIMFGSKVYNLKKNEFKSK